MAGAKAEASAETGAMTRRQFLEAAGLLVCGVTIGSSVLLTGCGSKPAPAIGADAFEVDGNLVTVMLAKAPELATVGGSASITSDSPQVYLVIARTAEDGFVVVSNRCTHRGKAIVYDGETGHFMCVSGKSEFRLDGTVVRGPADRPLRTYRWRVEDGRLIIDLTT